MEPLDDRELAGVLEAWRAPEAPVTLRRSLFPRDPAPWWLRFWRSGIRIPTPLVVGLGLLLLAILGVRQADRASKAQPATQVTFRELRPVDELKVRIIRRQYE